MTAKVFPSLNAEDIQLRTILRWRWFIVLVSASIVFIIELLDHEQFDLHVTIEILAYGVAIPACTWFLLTFLVHQMTRQAALTKDLEQHRHISRQLVSYQDRKELAQFVTRFPSTSMPVERVILFQYDHLKAQMEFVDEWNANGPTTLPGYRVPTTTDARYAWQLAQSPGAQQACTCALITGTPDENSVPHVCLPLVYDKMLVGLLRLRCLAGQSLSDQQLQFLNTIAPHVALALALSIAFPRQMTEAQRTERRRMAYELHDSLAQQISYLHLTLDRLAEDDRLENAAWLRTELDRLREVASEAYLEVRNNLALIRDEETLNLTQTIADYIDSITPHTPFTIEFETVGTPASLGPLTCQHVLGLIQESVNNIQKHAQAQRVRLALFWHADRLDITVVDDGAGFDLDAVQSNGHYGLTILQERIQELRGEMQITSARGAGTSLHFEIPLRTL